MPFSKFSLRISPKPNSCGTVSQLSDTCGFWIIQVVLSGTSGFAVTNENQAECKENFLLVGQGKRWDWWIESKYIIYVHKTNTNKAT